jgi:Mg-chelatase subunit ChlD
MKSKIIAIGLLALTAIAVVLYPKIGNSTRVVPPVAPPVLATNAPAIEVVFALDTTGSMSGLIEAAKEKIWSIANSLGQAQNSPDIRIGLVANRDRGDAYVTQVTDLSKDLDSVYATLMDFKANGGGDTPESVNAALFAAIDQISWSDDPGTYQAVFLVGDAPSHMDYQDEPKYPHIMQQAVAKGVIVNTIRCGESSHTEQQWQQIAALTQGQYLSVEQDGGAVAMVTPFDAKLAELSLELDDTRLSYGDAAAQALAAGKAMATDKLHAFASTASRARRAAFNAMESGRQNQFADSDLVVAVEDGTVDLHDVETENLPAAIRHMAPEARFQYVEQQATKRKELNAKIERAIASREAYIAEQEVTESFVGKMFDIVKDQAEKKGVAYDESAAPKL